MENEQITPRKRGGNDVSSNRRTADERAQALASTFREIRRAGFVTLGAIARELDRRQVPMARGGKKWHPTPIVQEAAAGGSSAGAGIAAGDRATNKLGPNDKVRIIVFGQPTLTGEYTLDGNGVLAFPLIGNIPASGSTTAELQKAIAAKLEPEYLINPSVSAEIVTRRPP
jgi:hypothetical protein